MSDVRGAILDRIWDAIAGPATASTSMTVLIVAAFFLGAQLLSEHRQVAAALRVAGLRSEERRVGKECRSRWSP